MSAYSMGKMSADPRHSAAVSVRGAGLPASLHARDTADAARNVSGARLSTMTSTL
jgi:hypothetical protein